MKSFKWMKVFLLVLILSAFNEVNGLNNEGEEFFRNDFLLKFLNCLINMVPSH